MSKPKRSRQKKPSAHPARKNRKSGKNPASSNTELTPERLAKRERFRTRTLPLIILVLVSFLAYANAWPDELIWDDAVFAMGDRLSGVTWAELWQFFTSDAWASIGLETGLYRPLLMASVSLDILLFGQWKAGFHLINILLHALCTVSVFGLIRCLLERHSGNFTLSSYVALLAAIVFAVHPVHTEVVNSVFNRSEMLTTLAVAGGLWWFLPAEQKQPWKAWSVLAVVYLLAMLSRETGIMLPAIAVVVLWLSVDGGWKSRLRRCLPVFWLLIPLAIYLAMRAHALDTPMTLKEMASSTGTTSASPERHNVPVLGMVLDFNRVLPAVAVWYEGLKLMLWPNPLMTFHNTSDVNRWLALAVQLVLLGLAAFGALKKRPGPLIGLTFFYLAILPASRIVGESFIAPHLAERYLYLPSAGIAIVLAFGLAWLARKFSLKQAVIAVMTASLILTPLTWARNSKWISTEVLAETDMERGARSDKLTSALLSTLLLKGKTVKAGSVCDRHPEMIVKFWYIAGYCGQVYALLRQYGKAENALRASMERKQGESSAHYALAVMYLGMSRREDAIVEFDLAVETESKPFLKEYLAAEALMRLYPANYDKLAEARAHMEKSIELHPQYFQSRQRLGDLDAMMNALGRREQ